MNLFLSTIISILFCLPVNDKNVKTTKMETKKSQEDFVISLANGVYKKWGHKASKKTIIIVDFSIPIEKERLFIVDLESNKIIKKTRVSHGVGSGMTSIPTNFSNEDNSKASSKGVMLTAETYSGSWGYSMKVDGLEDGTNSNVRKRVIVFHNSDKQRTQWSWGCFSIPGKDYKSVIDITKGGSLIFAYSNQLECSKYLN